ncbi:hypothetical protein DCAR_0208189 [Daucus carota subsp. sativus]|uniref:MADS-box domain-containing protein n=1 Tax=Daucus carota subsp. sativus TaxID=79200 RepID=A0AAF0WFZ2_DAUCS|nr:hypothetical protein DCAR_0208189 [Daucus carota subsp. sativus]
MKNTEIKKIENTGARRVTFCKRKKGIFKKTEELSVLCDADVALIIIDSTGQLFQYASSRMNDILERHSLYLKNLPEKEQTSADKKKQTSAQIRGEILEGMSKEELEQLEKSLENKLSRLVKKKSEMIMIEIETLQQKEMRLMKENIRLKQQLCKVFIDRRIDPVISSHLFQSQAKQSQMPSLCKLCQSDLSFICVHLYIFPYSSTVEEQQ